MTDKKLKPTTSYNDLVNKSHSFPGTYKKLPHSLNVWKNRYRMQGKTLMVLTHTPIVMDLTSAIQHHGRETTLGQLDSMHKKGVAWRKAEPHEIEYHYKAELLYQALCLEAKVEAAKQAVSDLGKQRKRYEKFIVALDKDLETAVGKLEAIQKEQEGFRFVHPQTAAAAKAGAQLPSPAKIKARKKAAE